MQNFAVIGLGQFGKCMVESLAKRNCDVVVLDQDEKKVDWARDLVANVVKADVLNFGVFDELFPKGLHCAIVDLGEHMEPSILVTNHLHKLQVTNIVVQALNPQHAEILQIVGATKVVFPEKEAAERVAGTVTGHRTLEYFPVSDVFSVIEIQVPLNWIGHDLAEMRLRTDKQILLVAFRKQGADRHTEPWQLASAERAFETGDIVLLAGTTKSLRALTK
ncbi:MAG: TrkA family potassium uptake protein [Planctomycetes bacterium]|nr:TrkA family potassium uptake protein [Planctomycetota bacterium]